MGPDLRSGDAEVISLEKHRAVPQAQKDYAHILGLVEELWSTFSVEATVEPAFTDEGDVSFCVTVGGTDYLVLPRPERPGFYNTFRVEADGSITPRLDNVPAYRCLTYQQMEAI